ncbi:MAG: hypothetical protein R3242_11830 [Akkermansiaceae bacterium]|nr:hypothetical protein [Akkermansiaceae bacterium]
MKNPIIPAAFALLFASLLYAQDAPKAFQKDLEREVSPFEPEPRGPDDPYDHFDPYSTAPKAVRIQVEFIELSHLKLSELLMDYKPRKTDSTDLRKMVQKLLKSDEAKLIDTLITVARSGEKATTESIEEYIYPTEYDPPITPVDSDNKPLPLPVNPCLPTAFETRNVGSTLEVEPTIGENDKMVNLRFIPEVVQHTGNVLWQEFKDNQGNVYKTQMPNFYTIRLNTAITTYTGQYYMAGTLSPRDEEGKHDSTRKIMIFVKCDILATVP